MTAPSPFVGIDIAKADSVVALRPSAETWTSPNDDAGVANPRQVRDFAKGTGQLAVNEQVKVDQPDD